MQPDRVTPQALAELGLEEVLAVSDHVVQQEEAIRLAQEQQLLGLERQERVVGTKEARERWFEERRESVAELRTVADRARDAAQGVEVQRPRRGPEPVVVPAVVQAERAPGAADAQ